MGDVIKAIDSWETNGHLIANCAKLGYLRKSWYTLDPTYGLGTFWKVWRPAPGRLIGTDIDPTKSTTGKSVDFTALPWSDRSFETIVFDPPYKLNGTPDSAIDGRYGVDTPTRWQDRMDLCRRGIEECARVLSAGYLLVKCQDQACSGKIRWQTTDFTEVAESCGLGLVDRFDFLSYRPQPTGTRQVTARRCSSQLLVFKRGWSWRG